MTSNVFPMSYIEPCFLLSSPRFDFPSRFFSIPYILSTTIISISLSLHLVLLAPVAETWRRVWGDRKIFRGPRFPNDVFLEKIYIIFTAKISDDLFLVIDQVFRSFPFFSQISRLFYYTKCRLPHTRTTTISQKNSFMTPFLLCSYTFARIRQHYFSKYWGDGCTGRPPSSNVWGDRPLQSP